MNNNLIFIYDKEYPALLKNIQYPPEKLYFLGDISLLDTKCVSIVGNRNASPYGLWAAFEIAKRLAQKGYTIVSGLALGVDAAAHKGAISVNGKTIAVLGTAIDHIYPYANKDLFIYLQQNDLIISEYGIGEKTNSLCFPQRNRIISGLSNSTIVIEGSLKSGSMITANYALNQGRDVYALPGNINCENSLGTNSLIRDGAIPICSLCELDVYF